MALTDRQMILVRELVETEMARLAQAVIAPGPGELPYAAAKARLRALETIRLQLREVTV